MSYGPGTVTTCYDGGALFERVCPECGRFVKADKTVYLNGRGECKPNARCKVHGRITMPFLGYY